MCLERKPIVTPRPNEIEEKFQKLLAQIEYERSLKSDFEVRHELDLYVIRILIIFRSVVLNNFFAVGKN